MALSVLVVSDDPSITEMVGEYLEVRGLEVVRAEDGPAAARLLDERSVDALVAELRMPQLGGLDLLERVRQAGHPIGVVLLAGTGGMEDGVAALRGGAHDLLGKPFRLSQLHEALLTAVERARAQAEAVRVPGLLALLDQPVDAAELARALVALPGVSGAWVRLGVDGAAAGELPRMVAWALGAGAGGAHWFADGKPRPAWGEPVGNGLAVIVGGAVGPRLPVEALRLYARILALKRAVGMG